ncbi:hypothetical protein ACFSUM_17365 [Virgibacillus siamensis]
MSPEVLVIIHFADRQPGSEKLPAVDDLKQENDEEDNIYFAD